MGSNKTLRIAQGAAGRTRPVSDAPPVVSGSGTSEAPLRRITTSSNDLDLKLEKVEIEIWDSSVRSLPETKRLAYQQAPSGPPARAAGNVLV